MKKLLLTLCFLSIVSCAHAQSWGDLNALTLSFANNDTGTVNALTIYMARNTTGPFSIYLPGAQGGANTFLMNDGSGNLTWNTLGGVLHAVLYNPSTALPTQLIQPQSDFVPLAINDTVTGFASNLQAWRINGHDTAWINHFGDFEARQISSSGGILNLLLAGVNQIDFHDASGNTGTLQNFNGYGSNRTYTLPDASGTVTVAGAGGGLLTAGTGISVTNSSGATTITATGGGVDSADYILNQTAATQTAGFSIGGTAHIDSTLTMGTANSLAGRINLSASGALGDVAIESNSAQSGEYIWTFPLGGGSNGQVLKSTGFGVTAWANPSSLITDYVKTDPATTADNTIVPSADIVELTVRGNGTQSQDVMDVTDAGPTISYFSVLTNEIQTQTSHLDLAGPSFSSEIEMIDSSLSFTGYLVPPTQTAPHVWTLPDSSGTIALTSSIPSVPTPANPTAHVSGSAVNGSATTFMRSDAAPALANTAVSAGSYTNTNLTVDAQGRITAASSGSGGLTNPMTALGDLIKGGASGAPTRLAGNMNNYVECLTSTASSGVAQAPAWNTIMGTDYGVSSDWFIAGAGSGGIPTGTNDIAIGVNSMSAVSISGSFNTAIGSATLNSSPNNSDNTAIGYSAASGGASTDCTAIGYEAIVGGSGTGNTAVGSGTMSSLIIGNDNTAIGFQADISGFISNAMALGYQASVSDANTIQLGNSSVVSVGTYGHILTQSTVGATARDGTGITASSVVGSDVAGTVTFTSALNAAGGFVQVSFGTTYTNAPTVVVFPSNANASSLALADGGYVTSTATAFKINFSATIAKTGCTYNYIVIRPN